MTRETTENIIREKLKVAPALGARYKFDMGDDGVIFIDGMCAPPSVSASDEEADTVFVCSLDTAKGIADGTQDPTMAFMTGKLKVQGSMGYALKLASLLED